MKEQFIKFETAKLAKEKGFDWSVWCYYCDDGRETQNFFGIENPFRQEDLKDMFLAPTQSLLQRWLREKNDIHVIVDFGINGYYCHMKRQELNKLYKPGENYWVNTQNYPISNYEEALEKGLFEALKLI